MNRRGVFTALPLRPEACNGRMLCDLACTQLAITVAAKAAAQAAQACAGPADEAPP